MSYAGYCRLNPHVTDTSRDVIKAIRKRFTRDAYKAENRTARHAYIRAILQEHDKARELFRAVQRGLY